MAKAQDLIGQRFGKLTVVRRIDNSEYGQARWECLCDCGNTCNATSSILRAKRGGKTSCGCAAFFDLTGKRFGMLVVIERAPYTQKGKVVWHCLCDCGNETFSTSANLRGGLSASCGCVRIKHMGKGTLLYRTWAGMKTRCYNQEYQGWHRYGGRGITVCDEWKNDFASFRDWSLSHGYKEGLSIDRVNNDGNYCPENCEWVTISENSKRMQANRRGRQHVA